MTKIKPQDSTPSTMGFVVCEPQQKRCKLSPGRFKVYVYLKFSFSVLDRVGKGFGDRTGSECRCLQ